MAAEYSTFRYPPLIIVCVIAILVRIAWNPVRRFVTRAFLVSGSPGFPESTAAFLTCVARTH
jgi:hypothetical protein